MSTTATRISQIQLVMIPSTDQDRSVKFYETLGFEKRLDIPWGDGYRWVEGYLPDSTTGIALVPPRPGVPTWWQTRIILNTDDIDATHSHLRSIGVGFYAAVARLGSPVSL